MEVVWIRSSDLQKDTLNKHYKFAKIHRGKVFVGSQTVKECFSKKSCYAFTLIC